MERQTIIERSAAAIGKPYTQELHAAWVVHLAAVETAYQDMIRHERKVIAENVRAAVEAAVAI